MYVPSFIRIERNSDDFKLNKVSFLLEKPGNINVLRSAAPKLALVPASRNNCDVKASFVNIFAMFLQNGKRFTRGPMFKLNKMHLSEYQCFEVCCAKTSTCASKLL